MVNVRDNGVQKIANIIMSDNTNKIDYVNDAGIFFSEEGPNADETAANYIGGKLTSAGINYDSIGFESWELQLNSKVPNWEEIQKIPYN